MMVIVTFNAILIALPSSMLMKSCVISIEISLFGWRQHAVYSHFDTVIRYGVPEVFGEVFFSIAILNECLLSLSLSFSVSLSLSLFFSVALYLFSLKLSCQYVFLTNFCIFFLSVSVSSLPPFLCLSLSFCLFLTLTRFALS